MVGIDINTDKNLLDLDLIINYLQNSYWASNRSAAAIRTSINKSICFGAYSGELQIGFARVVTDGAVFAYLMDVFILDQFRGKGYGSTLIDAVLRHEDLKNIETFKLATHDAHEFYEKKGFRPIAHPEFQMEKLFNHEL